MIVSPELSEPYFRLEKLEKLESDPDVVENDALADMF
jgi:hypothetical protein